MTIRLRTLLPTLLLTMLMMACGQTDDIPENIAQQGSETTTGPYVIHLGVALPATPDIETRAVNNHGTKEESKVYDGILAIFKASEGGNEKSATLLQAYSLSEQKNADGAPVIANFKDNPKNGITLSSNIVLTLDHADLDLSSSNILYALVLLNCVGNGLFSVGTDDKLLYHASNPLTTLSAVQAVELDNIGSTASGKGFFMSNAPMYKEGVGVTTLVEVTKVFLDLLQAKNSDATMVFVERAAVKVVASNKMENNRTGISLDNNTSNKLRIHKMEYAIANACSSYYALRDYATSDLPTTYWDKNNMFEDGKMRTMWAKTVSYNTKPTSTETFQAMDTPFYIAEHTMSTSGSADNATSIVVRVQLKDASNVLLQTDLWGNTGKPNILFTTKAKRDAYVSANGLTVSNNVKFTKGTDGYSYMEYVQPITHNVDASTMTGVVRDNVYHLNVKTFSRFGDRYANE